MCGRFTLTTRDVHDLARALAAEVDAAVGRLHRPRWNVAPTDEHWIVRLVGGRRVLRRARFGVEAPNAVANDGPELLERAAPGRQLRLI